MMTMTVVVVVMMRCFDNVEKAPSASSGEQSHIHMPR